MFEDWIGMFDVIKLCVWFFNIMVFGIVKLFENLVWFGVFVCCWKVKGLLVKYGMFGIFVFFVFLVFENKIVWFIMLVR